jgi:hypothetical protein
MKRIQTGDVAVDATDTSPLQFLERLRVEVDDEC